MVLQSAQEQLAQLWSFQGMAPDEVRSITWELADISCRITKMQLWQSGGARKKARTSVYMLLSKRSSSSSICRVKTGAVRAKMSFFGTSCNTNL